MARFPGFNAGTYQSQSALADAEQTINLFPELVESNAGINRYHMISTPGLKVFATPNSGSPVALDHIEINRKGSAGTAIASLSVASGEQRVATVGTNVSAFNGTFWNNPGNVSSTTNYADSSATPSNHPTDMLYATAFGETLPGATVVTGIQVDLEVYCTGGVTPLVHCNLVKGGIAWGYGKIKVCPGSPQNLTIGGPTDLWGVTPSVDDVKDATFGCSILCSVQGDTGLFYVRNVRITVYRSPRALVVKLNAACPYSLADQVIGYGATTFPYLNGIPFTVLEVSGDTFSVVALPEWDDYGPAADTGDYYLLGPSLAYASLASMPFSVGQGVTFSGVVAAAFLNGQSTTISAIAGNVISGPFTHADYAYTADTGVVVPGAGSGLAKSRGMTAVNKNRMFDVVGDTLYELFQDGTFANRGTVANDGASASLSYSAIELLVASGGLLYLMNLATNVFAAVPNYKNAGGAIPAVKKVEYCDGYFLALLTDTQRLIVSDPLDGSSWDASMIGQVSVFPDNVVSMLVDHREVVMWGTEKAVVYYDSGNTFPFDVIQGSYMDQGSAATFSHVRLDNSNFWIGQDDRGGRMCWRMQGYIPQRVSTHAVEAAWEKYSTVSDAVAYGFQLTGHAFYHVYFPTANASWRYDVATSMWHEVRSYAAGAWGAHRSQTHVYCWEKHFVGDWHTPNIFEMSMEYNDDAGQERVCLRRSPYIANELKWIFHNQLQLHVEAGEDPDPPLLDPVGDPRPPQVMLRWSDNGGKSWSNEHWSSAGLPGEYNERVIWRRLGKARQRLYEIAMTDGVSWKIVDCYIEVS
jgi:hypothetical protein